jgi:purine-binding chemotaxis protein CheW
MNNHPEVQDLLDEIGRLQTNQATDVSSVPSRKVLGLQLAEELYGLEITGIRGISRLQPLTYVPGTPPTIIGVTSLRGQMLPVVDLRIALGMEAQRGQADTTAARSRARIVVVNQGDTTAGLLVDGVTEVYEIRGAAEPPLGMRGSAPLTEGQVQIGDHMLVLLNLPNLIARLTA